MDYTSLPKAILHDHLDGGLRVATIIELADGAGYTRLPTTDATELAEWFHQGQSGSLERYLEAFEHTFGVMQNQDAIQRVAYEAGLDLAADGVVYAEVRFGPSLHTFQGLSREDAIEAVLDGLSAAGRETGIVLYGIASALRHEADSEAVANAAVAFAGQGLVAFDLAGPEAGYPADDHEPACRLAAEHGLGLTIHAGESDDATSIWRALAHCGAQRIGHGVRIADDTTIVDGTITGLGSLAGRVRDHRIPLEVAVTSNLHTHAVPPGAIHPFGGLYRAGFNVSINTDNRLMSSTASSVEYELAVDMFGLAVTDLAAITVDAIEAGFGDWPTRRRLIDEVVLPGYASAASNQSATSEST
ncbi:MAG: adenosine deaminase [Acidimicrobiia bacterium]|nr:MAG: adenosine deaminase [Acidimicrobiia bacterium]